MKRWAGALGVVILVCLRILMVRASGAALLQDTDTNVLVHTIQARNAPFSWFTGDWPLQNHFYRPVSTLAFEMDLRLYGHQAWGYGLTNALLCVLCTLLLLWYLRELTDKPLLAGSATVLFGLWQTGDLGLVTLVAQLFVWAVFVGGIVRHRLKVSLWLPAALVASELLTQIVMAEPIGSTTLDWLPGRTATVMTVFALAASAAYARYERTSAERKVADPTPTDPPATRSSTAPKARGAKVPWLWVGFAVVCMLFAFASYEQAVMLPAIMLATAVTMRWQGYRVRWGWQAAFWTVLVAYLALRHAIVPSDASKYQLQQFRNGPGVWLSIANYLFPSLFSLPSIPGWLESMPVILITPEPWRVLWGFFADITTAVKARKHLTFIVAGWGMAAIAYLPMAWLKQFGHYHYWPLALKSLFVATLGWLAWDLAVTAWSPQTRQAPPRRDPAPGSLPRR